MPIAAQKVRLSDSPRGRDHATSDRHERRPVPVCGAAKPRPDFKDKDRQATTRDGAPIWTVRLDAIEPDRETKETIWVEVAGEQPRPITCVTAEA